MLSLGPGERPACSDSFEMLRIFLCVAFLPNHGRRTFGPCSNTIGTLERISEGMREMLLTVAGEGMFFFT